MTPSSNPGAVVIDANVFIALGAREQAKLAVAETALADYAARGWLFYAPGVIVAEVLYILITAEENILGGEPIIKGTRTPVRAIVEIWRLGTPMEEIPNRLPHLTLSQVFAALSYYSDHQVEINEYIRRNHVPDELLDPLVLDL